MRPSLGGAGPGRDPAPESASELRAGPELGEAAFGGWGRRCCPRQDERGGRVRAGSPWAWLHTDMSETPARRLLAGEVAGLGQPHGVPARLTNGGPGQPPVGP